MLTLTALECRSAPALSLTVEYGLNFFADPAARASFDAVAGLFARSLTSAPQMPAALTLRVDVRELGGATLGEGGPTSDGGAITFDAGTRWHFGASVADLAAGEIDFTSVAVHELGHVLGIGTAPAWFAQSAGGHFHGAHAEALYGSPVPLDPAGQHWGEGVTLGGRAVALDPTESYGVRVGFSALDAAALQDLGWGVDFGPLVEPLPTPGVPFAGYRGAVSLGAADVTGDHVPDWVASVVVGTSHVKVFDGATGREARSFLAYEGYAGPTCVALGDLDGDGCADLVTLAANRHLKAFDGKTGALVVSELR